MENNKSHKPAAHVPITYADAQPDLPKSAFAQRLAKLRINRIFGQHNGANDNAVDLDSPDPALHLHEQKEATMVEQERPFPAPRPSFEGAQDVDAQAFNTRWEAERLRAAQTILTPSETGDIQMTDEQNTPNSPAETLREGSLKAAIWRNETENGPYHSVTLARTYKDRDGQLQDTANFRTQDLLPLAELARQTHHQARDLDREMFKEQRRAEQSQGQSQERSQDQSR